MIFKTLKTDFKIRPNFQKKRKKKQTSNTLIFEKKEMNMKSLQF